MQFVLVKRDMVFLTVVHVINGSVPHTLLAPLTNSLVVVERRVAVVGADPSEITAPVPSPSPGGATGALLGRGRCCANVGVAFLTVRRYSRGFVATA